MKRMIGIVIVAVAVAFAGFTSPAFAKDIKIGIVVETLGNPYFACLKRSAEAEAKKHPNVKLTVLSGALGTDLIGVTKMIDDMIQKRVHVLAFSAIDPNAMVQTVKKVQKSGIRVLIHSDDLAKQVARHFVGPDQYYGQSAVAKAAAEELGGKGKVALMEGVPGNMSSILRKRGRERHAGQVQGHQGGRHLGGQLGPRTGFEEGGGHPDGASGYLGHHRRERRHGPGRAPGRQGARQARQNHRYGL